MPEHTPAPTPSRAVYGFAMFLTFRTLSILYLMWGLVPEEWFRIIGITCLPQRYWAITIPIFLLTVLAIFTFLIYPNLGLFLTPSVDDLVTIQDCTIIKRHLDSEIKTGTDQCSCNNTQKCLKKDYERNCGDFVTRTIPALQNLNIWEVSEHLYLK